MSDKRFNALFKDPRYRLPSKKEARTSVDPRFKTLFTDQEFRKKASVDRYGRKVKPEAGKNELERLYRLDKKAKPASASEESDEDDADESADEASVKRDPARDGFSGSESSEEESSGEDDESDEEELGLAADTAGNEQTEDIPMGEVSKRLACVNLDFDNIRAADVMAVASSFAPTSGRVESVTIYPSEFGRERLQREELEGPPREIFASSSKKKRVEEEEDESSDEDDEKIKQRLLEDQADDGAEFDTAKLRQYQLERLRYYYAVIECSDKGTAKTLYDSMDGREYLSTSNFFDLRFIPDDTSFEDDTPHDECQQLPQGYKPNDFRTEALTHSKVRLTWDDDDATRKEVQKRAFSRAEMDENDLQAYIGSDDSDADSVASRVSTAEQKRKAKSEAKRAKAREAFGLALEPAKSSRSKPHKDEVVGDMQITFTSGLSSKDKKGSVFENEPQDEESTRQRYIRKEKERKQARKERAKARNGNADEDEESEPDTTAAGAEDDPFNDPFFNDPAASAVTEKVARKASKDAKRAAREAANAEAESRRAELDLLMTDEQDNGVRHFDMREIEKAEKQARKKGKGKKKGSKETVVADTDDFEIETSDPRFKALFDSHEYAIDPTAPAFKKTRAMQGVLEEKRKRKNMDVEEEEDERPSKKKSLRRNEEDDVKGLVARLKNKGKK